MKRLAVIVGGWHFPWQPYASLAALPLPDGWTRDLFVVTHRNPNLEIVRTEKLEALQALPDDFCGACDREMYRGYPTAGDLRELGWQVQEDVNSVGDWGFFNQWLEMHDYREYDLLLNCHDDTYIRGRGLFLDVLQDERNWLILGNGRYPQAPSAYVRGSFEFWRPEMLGMLGGRIDLGDVKLTREGQTNTPSGLDALYAWNDTAVPVRDFMVSRGLADRVAYLSPHYRISRHAIEGERGFISERGGAPWSFEAGLQELAA